jgi:hypothetical protein
VERPLERDFSGWKVVTDKATHEITRHMLYSEYCSTILAEWDHFQRFPTRAGSRKLYLTLFGRCVHRNPMEIIAEAIARNMDVIRDSGLDMFVVCFQSIEFDAVYLYLKEAIESTGGRLVDVR